MKLKLKNIKLGIVLTSFVYSFTIIILYFSIGIINIGNNYGLKKSNIVFGIFLLIISIALYSFNNIFKFNQKRNYIKKIYIISLLAFWLFIAYFKVPIFLFYNAKVTFIILEASIFAAILEETIFRGIFYSFFYYNKAVYLLFSSLLFGLIHYHYGLLVVLTSFISGLILGLILGLARLNNISILILILIHFFHNIPYHFMNVYHLKLPENIVTYQNILILIALLLSISLTIWYLSKKEVWKSDFTLEKTKKKSIWYYIFEYYGDFKNDPLKNGETVTNPGLLEK